jgi:hypothetical protein
MGKVDRSVVRNQAYRKSEFSIRERHNERKNEAYFNADIQPDRRHLNVHFKQCQGSYSENFDAMLAAGAISTRGQKADAKVFDELVFDVNSAYFEHNGGYDYAKQFFAEAYNLAVKEVGGEQYVLSAVLHADERNKALSEQHGRDVYHYHLHVVYVPVVDKEVRWSKRCKDPALVGTVREVVKQVSHSKKWPRYQDETGAWINSYSLLQDRFHEHMREKGFTDFERGERGSTTEHLSVLEYKTQQEAERATTLEEKADKAQARLDGLKAKTAIAKKEIATFADIDRMGGKKTILGAIALAPDDWNVVSKLAKEAIKSRGIIAELKKQAAGFIGKIKELTQRLTRYEGTGPTDMMRYFEALQRAPRRLAETVADIRRQPPEKAKPERTAPTQKRSTDVER